MDNFRSQKTNIIKKKAYLQTALYNAVLEYEAMVANDLRGL